MFDSAYELGASLSVRNVLNLTPLTLAAKLARKDMFFHVLNIEREIYWQIGEQEQEPRARGGSRSRGAVAVGCRRYGVKDNV